MHAAILTYSPLSGSSNLAARPNIATMTKTIRVGILGAGFLAETRARCYAAVAGVDVEVRAVASRTLQRAAALAQRHSVPYAVSNVDELLAKVDVVDLCVPNREHRQLAERAAAAGKHVICTKPLTAYVGQDLPADATDAAVATRDARTMLQVAVADAQAMLAATRAAGVRLFYGENWLYAPAIERAAQLFAKSGGTLLEMRGWEAHSGSHSRYAKVWRNTGGGALLRLAAHPIGAMLHFKRQEGLLQNGKPIRPVSVTADVDNLTAAARAGDPKFRVATGWVDVENWGCAIVRFADGSRAVAYGSDNVLGGMESRFELYGSNFRLNCNLSPNDMLQSYAADPTTFGDEYRLEKLGANEGWSPAMPNEDWTSGQQGMIDSFMHDIALDREPRADGELGLDVVRVIYGAYVAAREGRRFELPEWQQG